MCPFNAARLIVKGSL